MESENSQEWEGVEITNNDKDSSWINRSKNSGLKDEIRNIESLNLRDKNTHTRGDTRRSDSEKREKVRQKVRNMRCVTEHTCRGNTDTPLSIRSRLDQE